MTIEIKKIPGMLCLKEQYEGQIIRYKCCGKENYYLVMKEGLVKLDI